MKGVKGQEAEFMPGDIIFTEGDESSSLMYIQDGRIEVYREREGTEISLGVMAPGEFLGTVTLFSKEPRTASAKAVTQVKLLVMKASQLEQGLKDVPVWIQAVVKDTVARLKYVDERLVETKLKERQLSNKVGTPLHTAAQLCRFIVALMKTGCVQAEDQEVLPTSGMLKLAANVVLRPLEPVANIYGALVKCGVIKETSSSKVGQAIPKSRATLLDEFATFALGAAKSGVEEFAPAKLLPFMNALAKVRTKLPDADAWARTEVSQLLTKELGREIQPETFEDLVEFELCKTHPNDSISFNGPLLEKRAMFESACRAIAEEE